MSNARNLANLLGTATTIQTSKIADDAITNAKLSDSDSFTVGGLTVSGASTFQGATTATSTTDGFGGDDAVLLNATDGSATDAGDHLVLNSSASGGTDDGENVLFEDGTGDPNTLLNSNDTRLGGTINFLSKVKFDTATEGAGGLDLLIDNTSVASSLGNFDFDIPDVGVKYDDYLLIFTLRPDTDNVSLEMRVKDGQRFRGGLSDAALDEVYAYESALLSGNEYVNNNDDDSFKFNTHGIGNATGEGIKGHLFFSNTTSAVDSFNYRGFVNFSNNSGNHNGNACAGQMIGASANGYAVQVTGFRFFMSGGQMTGNIKLYGIRT